jgi:hypothetical protein
MVPRFLGKFCTFELHVIFRLLAGMIENGHEGYDAG